MRIKILFFSLIIFFTYACDNKLDLTHPDTIKGMKLGMDADEQARIAGENGICEDSFGTFEMIRYNYDLETNSLVPFTVDDKTCQYKLNSEIVVHPKANLGYFKGKKVLSDVVLLFHSPSKYSFLTLKEGNGELDSGRPAVSWSQVKQIITLYDNKYGKGSGGNIHEWISGDLHITMNAFEYLDIEEKCCCCVVRYQYIKEKRKLLSFDDPNKAPI